MNKTLTLLLAGILILFQISNVESFDVDTHEALGKRVVLTSSLDDFLKTQLGLRGGVEETVSGVPVIRWIQEGSKREDDNARFLNHFHDPIRTWDQAGLQPTLFGVPIGRPWSSSVLWGQNPSQGFAWQNARESYFSGLTATTQAGRENNLAQTFRALGQLMHLVQDAALPAHTRNDPHPPWNPDGLERFVENIRTEDQALFDQLTGTSQGFDPSILTLPPNPVAPISIARIIDATDPEQTAAFPSAGTNQGLAEYSNANFLSGDTIFKGFTFPRIESINLDSPVPVDNRLYYPKLGETNFFLVAEGTFTERLISLAFGDKGFVLDPVVYQDYASFLLPRAVGYSAGLLDYFFRGRIELIVQTPNQEPGSPVTLVRVNVKNTTPGEETGSGEVIAIATFTKGGQQSFAVSSPQVVNLTRDFQEIVFGFSQSPIPPDASSLFLIVIYRGPLGLEEQAVIAGGKRFSLQPALVCRGPNFCFRWFTVEAAGATLTVEGDGANNSGVMRASDLTAVGGDCQDCGTQVPVTFNGPTTVSLTAPTARDTAASFFELNFSVQNDGFVCFLSVTSPQGIVGVWASQGFTEGACPP